MPFYYTLKFTIYIIELFCNESRIFFCVSHYLKSVFTSTSKTRSSNYENKNYNNYRATSVVFKCI